MLSILSLEAFTNRSWILVQTILKLAKTIDHKIVFAILINFISIIIKMTPRLPLKFDGGFIEL